MVEHYFSFLTLLTLAYALMIEQLSNEDLSDKLCLVNPNEKESRDDLSRSNFFASLLGTSCLQ